MLMRLKRVGAFLLVVVMVLGIMPVQWQRRMRTIFRMATRG